MNTFHALWRVRTSEEAKAKLEEQKAEAVAAFCGREPQNLEEQALCFNDRYQGFPIGGYNKLIERLQDGVYG